ncbi:MAG: PSD1 and planctomycete cytochrome C domain-containing protein [Armatimonadota bacterium]
MKQLFTPGWRRSALSAGVFLLCGVPAAALVAQKPAPKKPARPAAAPKPSAAATKAPVEFAREVQPILKASCIQCHGPEKALGGLRLDTRELALKGGVSGTSIVPGKGAKSLLVTRMLGHGGKPRMPLGFAPLPAQKIAAVQRWIDQGAEWSEAGAARHWSFEPLRRPRVPAVKNRAWVKNPVDAFVLARLEQERLQPSPEADRITLLRRVTLDLTGLPPTPAEVDAFLADRSPDAYEKVVDRLLASPAYGERMALPWLDAARYADSNGFQQDGDTYQYIWRDWLVRALNENMPFDQFTTWQLAGDLLPDATFEQKLATGFNRLHLLNGEGGAIPEEQRNVILFDRVDVTATNWLGSTMACAQCHDHKYDPITQKDYYSFMAFFNNVPETGTPPFGGQYRIADPWMYAGSPEEMAKLKSLEEAVATAQQGVAAWQREHEAEIAEAQTRWEADRLREGEAAPKLDPWHFVGPFPAESFDAAYDTAFAPEQRVDLGAAYLDGKLKWAARPEWADGKLQELTGGENTAFYLYRTAHCERGGQVTLSLGSDDAIKLWVNGEQALANKVTRGVLPDQEKVTLTLKPGENRLLLKIVNGGALAGFYFKVLENGLKPDLLAILKTAPEARAAADAKKLRDAFLASAPPAGLQEARAKVAAADKARNDYQAALPRVMIMSDARPRKTHVLDRGNYEAPKEEVPAGTPAFLPPMPAGAPKNRLGLAQWLVSKQNPLTARVQVNRFWQHYFGNGLVKTSENFGVQSEPPSHPELLDWLAAEFRDGTAGKSRAWDMKHLHRLIVTSATYRQSSRLTPELRRRDPENRLLARGTRFRLPSMLLRDLALAASGLLDDRLGGKPVYPYQPKGIWDGLAITKERDFTYPQSTGKDLFRRSLYTFWRRTVAPANMFDASVRNACKVRLSITSTPLHALTTLNDVTWVEAGRALAERVMKEAGPDRNARLTEAFRRVCARRPSAEELRILNRSLDRALRTYRADRKAAEAYLKAGESPRDPTLDPAEHAAYASVCLAIFNLDEALTRE